MDAKKTKKQAIMMLTVDGENSKREEEKKCSGYFFHYLRTNSCKVTMTTKDFDAISKATSTVMLTSLHCNKSSNNTIVSTTNSS